MSFASLIATVVALQAGQFAILAQQQKGPTIRVYNAIQAGSDVRLDLWLDGAKVADGVAPESLSGPFVPTNETNARLVVKKPDGQIGVLELPVTLSGKDHVLVLLGKPEAKVDCVDVAVPEVAIGTDRPQINLVNAIPESISGGPVDVYVLGMDATLNTADPTSKGVGYEWSSSTSVRPGSYTIVVTKAGTKDVIAKSPLVYADKKDRKVAVLLAPQPDQEESVVLINLPKHS